MDVERRDLLPLVLPLSRACRLIEDECAASHSLSMWQYAVLSVVSNSPGLSQNELSERLSYSKNRVVGDLDLLSERQLLERRQGRDRRSNALHVTDAGRHVVADIRRRVHEHEDKLLGHMQPDERTDLRRLLVVASARPPQG